MDVMAQLQETQMDIQETTRNEARKDSCELGTASIETHGTPVGFDEPLGRNEVLGIASEETRGIADGLEEPLGHWTIGIASEETRGLPVGGDEPLGMDFKPGISAR